ncbi:hypothetical protein LZC95_50035 [Pendulispora brunnea]|uniref:Sigma-70 family RNA polymerase sigma factor n=1 Tax=Pendulispora brunnea TaxID=2905690 RepID=A0ABZ2K780_9BACT
MSTAWESLHKSLDTSIRTRAFHLRFLTAQRQHEPLRAFATARALIALLSKGAPSDEKNRLLAALVVMVQFPANAEQQDLASTLLWLALWSGLDAQYRHLQRYVHEPDELASLIGAAFTYAVRELQVTSDTLVAVTLVMNTRRRVVQKEKTQRKRAQIIDYLQDLAHGEDEDEALARIAGTPGPEEDDAQALAARLRAVCGEDAALLISIAVLGERQHEAALRLGISHAGAHLRYKRALEAARKYFSKKS